jgi:hypothetical protein
MGYDMSINWKSNIILTQKDIIKINVSLQAFMDDIIWITNKK